MRMHRRQAGGLPSLPERRGSEIAKFYFEARCFLASADARCDRALSAAYNGHHKLLNTGRKLIGGGENRAWYRDVGNRFPTKRSGMKLHRSGGEAAKRRRGVHPGVHRAITRHLCPSFQQCHMWKNTCASRFNYVAYNMGIVPSRSRPMTEVKNGQEYLFRSRIRTLTPAELGKVGGGKLSGKPSSTPIDQQGFR
jgi:hypothetical protein